MDSWVHRLDPRTKILLTIAMIVAVFLVKSMVGYGLILGFMYLVSRLSNIPFKMLMKGVKPLKVIRFPVHEVAMMMSLALRFVPTLLEETDKIMQAQRARGADMDSGNFIKRAKALVPILIPLFVSAFRRAYDIATAMECRCYRGGTGRTRMKTLHMGARDIVSFVVTAMIIGGVIVCNILLTSVL